MVDKQRDAVAMHLMKSLSFALGMLSLIWVGGLATADEITQGKALFMQYCASCHGPGGAGDGPLAPSLSTPPANLRLLALRFGNPLPRDAIARFIDGRADVKAHGPRDMPVWGDKFYAESSGEEAKVKERIAKLVAFLQSIQTGARTASLNLEFAASRRNQNWPVEILVPQPHTKAITGKEDRTNDFLPVPAANPAVIRGSFSAPIVLAQCSDRGSSFYAGSSLTVRRIHETFNRLYTRSMGPFTISNRGGLALWLF